MNGVLVTGATTPVGERLVRALAVGDRFTSVVAVSNEPPPPWLSDIPGGRVEYVSVDLCRAREVRALLHGLARERGVTAIVHTAFHRAASHDAEEARRLNVDATRELVGQAAGHPSIRRFVYGSSAEVYRVTSDLPILVGEDHPLEMSAEAPVRIRHRVEADVCVCTQFGLGDLRVQVLRFAEIFAEDSGSQLWDYLQTRVALRPLGFDPMVNLLSPADAVRALVLALLSEATGIFNIPGADTLPLSLVIRKAGRVGLAVPAPFLTKLYELRASTLGLEFRYDLNHRRFHFSAVLDGARAERLLGYVPREPVTWPTG